MPSASASAAASSSSSSVNHRVSNVRSTLHVVPWRDATVETIGFAARSDYVEWFWLPVLGPSATWLLRRIDAGFDEFPDGYMLDTRETARALGIAARDDAGTIFTRAIERLHTFGLAHGATGAYAVRRMLPPVSHRHLQRMPQHLRDAHEAWVVQGAALTAAA